MLYGRTPSNVVLLYTIWTKSTIINALTHRIGVIGHAFTSYASTVVIHDAY